MSVMSIYLATFICEFLEDAKFPSYKGFSLRGAFGFAFKHVSCNVRVKCSQCLLKNTCAYFNVFDVERLGNSKGKDIPRPFILEPPYNSRTIYNKGEEIQFGLIILGEYVRYFPFFVLAFEYMGRKGIGLLPNRAPFILKRVVDSAGKEVYNHRETLLKQLSSYQIEKISLNSILEVKILSPLRIKHKGRYVSPHRFSLDVFSLAVYRRLSFLNNLYGLFDERLLETADALKDCRIVSSSLRWKDLERYSHRQDTRMKMGGLIGNFILKIPSGKESEINRILKIIEVIHLGKNTTFGLGKIQIKEAEDGRK